MRTLPFLITAAFGGYAAGCGGGEAVPRSSTTSADDNRPAAIIDPASLPKVPADPRQITAMLRERFGEAVARNIRVEVEDEANGKRVALSGEVPDEETRQAVMREVETRVEGLTVQDFALDVSGPVPLLFGFDAHVDPGEPTLFPPDLSLTVTWAGDVYETATGRRINRIALPDAALKCMAFSADGRTLATGFRDGSIVLWEMPYGRNPTQIQPPADPTQSRPILALAFTNDGRQLVSVTGDHGEIQVRDLQKGAARLIGSHLPKSSPRALTERFNVAVSPDGQTVATTSFDESAVILWDFAKRSRKGLLDAEPLSPTALAWSRDGRLIAVARGVGDHRGVVLYDVASRKPKVLSLEEDSLVRGLAFSPDGRTLAVQYENDGVIIWDLPAGRQWAALGRERGEGEGIAFSPDGSVLATECDSLRPPGIRLWDVSKRPGGRASSVLPKAYPNLPTGDDRLAAEIERAIRGTFDRRNIESLTVSVQPDGAVKLTGRVSDAEVKRVAQLTAETHHVSDDYGPREPNKVINELEVTGRYGE